MITVLVIALSPLLVFTLRAAICYRYRLHTWARMTISYGICAQILVLFVSRLDNLSCLFLYIHLKLKKFKKETISGRYAHFWFYSIGSLNQFELIKYLSIQQIWTRINIFLPRQRQDVNWFISTCQASSINLSICKPFLVVWSQFCINESAYASPNKMFKPHICLATFVASFIKFRFDVKEHVYIV